MSSKKASRPSSSQLPQGYALIQRLVVDKDFFTTPVTLMVPGHVKEALELQAEQDRKQRLAAQLEQARLANEAQKFAQENERLQPEPVLTKEIIRKTAAMVTGGLQPPVLAEPVAGQDYDPKRAYPVYPSDAPSILLSRSSLNTPDKEVRKRDDELHKKLTAQGSLRDIAMPESVLAALDALRLKQPHFGSVIDLIRGQLLLTERTGKCVRIPPMLLDGEPGLGKTHFAFELAKALGTSVKRIAFDSALTSATLMGSERRWGNTQYGALFELICLGKHANPIVILDEIDKSEGRREWDPLAPLHTLLEPSTARFVRDISVDFEFDASMVTWIATSNKRARLPDSLRSRFREFHITQPDAQESIQLAMAVVAKTFADMQLLDFEPPAKAMAVCLAHLTAREIYQAMEQALAHAVVQGRNRVTPHDLSGELHLDEGHAEVAAGTNRSFKTAGKPPKTWLH